MDHASGNLSLLGGLDILGKLVFPDGYNLNLVTTMIAVQGELVMTASKPVDGTPQIKFTMIGNDDQMTFTPIDANANACKGVSTCPTGKKAIVVAGGKVNSKYQHVLSFAYRPCDDQSGFSNTITFVVTATQFTDSLRRVIIISSVMIRPFIRPTFLFGSQS